MFVDDDSLVRIGLKSIIDWKSKGFEIVGEASDGEEALKIIEEHKPDVVITDMYMPKSDGLELVKAARSMYPDILFVVLSCHNDINYVKESIRMGVFDYLLKSSIVDPSEMEKFLDKVSTALDDRTSNKNFYSKSEMNMPALSDNEFCALFPLYLSGQTGLYERIKNYLMNVRIDYDSKNLFLFGLVLNNFSKFKSMYESTKSFEKAVINMLNKIVSEYGGGIVLPVEDNMFFILFDIIIKNSVILPKDKALCIGERLRISVKNNYKITCSIFIDEGRDLDSLSETYENIIQGINSYKHSYDTIINLSDIKDNDKSSSNTDDVSFNPISNVIEYIHQNYRNQVTLDELAQKFNFSKYYLCKKFKDHTNTSINSYLLTVRIDKAKEMLLQKGHKISAIAQDVGFNDTPYFNRMFKKLTGYTPTEFKQYNHSMM